VATEADVQRIARALPGTDIGPDGLTLSVGGKAYAWPWLERVHPRKARVPNRQVLVARVAGELEKQALLALGEPVFFTEPHYDGYPAVLIRLAEIAPELLEDVLTDGWRTRASRQLQSEIRG
jgi:hypothetical protein